MESAWNRAAVPTSQSTRLAVEPCRAEQCGRERRFLFFLLRRCFLLVVLSDVSCDVHTSRVWVRDLACNSTERGTDKRHRVNGIEESLYEKKDD